MKTSELSMAGLSWAVAKCEGYDIGKLVKGKKITVRQYEHEPYQVFAPDINWAQGGPIIERENICLRKDSTGWYAVKMFSNPDAGKPFKSCLAWDGCGETMPIAAMRCYVASKLGDEVEIPEELQ